jgi:CheY-like chemotaxis protein
VFGQNKSGQNADSLAVEENVADKSGANVRRRARILLAEDYKDTAQSMAKLLELLGHEVLVVGDGPNAIAAAITWQPEIVLLDIGLPTLDGYEVARRLRHEESCKDIVIIAVTGYGQVDDLARSFAAGIDHHLLKPVLPGVLETLLSSLEPVSDMGDVAGITAEVP